AIKIFLLDDSDAIGRYISKLKNERSPQFTVYCVDSKRYETEKSIDTFSHAVLTEDVWRLACVEENPTPTQPNDDRDKKDTVDSLLSLTKNCPDGMFLFNINLKTTPFSFRQDQNGVELLKHIRLTEELGDARNLHAVLYSFEAQLELLKRKPGNLIMLSEGVTFHRLPDRLHEWTTVTQLSKLAVKRANVDQRDFKRFVQCDYQPPDSAHQFSNWWGLQQVVFTRREVLSKPDIPMPEIVNVNLYLLENKKTQFLFDDGIITSKNIIARQLESSLTESIKLIHKSSNIIYIDDEIYIDKKLAWGNLADWLKEDIPGISEFICYQPPEQIFDTDTSLAKWFIDKVIKKSGQDDPSLVLLDLRLQGDREADVQVRGVSGAKLASIIRKWKPGLPIILMTASNKAHSFEVAMKLGVDGYWMKEGVGEHFPQDGSS
ncbi:response regulator, partial [bacterium]|nr:response regulator [bacterium]